MVTGRTAVKLFFSPAPVGNPSLYGEATWLPVETAAVGSSSGCSAPVREKSDPNRIGSGSANAAFPSTWTAPAVRSTAAELGPGLGPGEPGLRLFVPHKGRLPHRPERSERHAPAAPAPPHPSPPRWRRSSASPSSIEARAVRSTSPSARARSASVISAGGSMSRTLRSPLVSTT